MIYDHENQRNTFKRCQGFEKSHFQKSNVFRTFDAEINSNLTAFVIINGTCKQVYPMTERVPRQQIINYFSFLNSVPLPHLEKSSVSYDHCSFALLASMQQLVPNLSSNQEKNDES